jgi:outer membrane protein assembly factor BamA
MIRILAILTAFLVTSLLCSGQQLPLPSIKKQKDSTINLSKNRFLAFPLVALSTETNWVFGVANAYIFRTDRKDSTLRLSTMPSGFLYTLNNQILIALGANIFLPKEKYIIRFENSYSKFPDKFWGIGNNTDNKEAERYTFTQFYINPQLYRKVYKDLFLGIGLDYQRVFDVAYTPNGYFDQDKVVGVVDEKSYEVFGYSFFVNIDSRNHTYVPNKGHLLRVRFTNFDTQLGSDYSFRAVEMDFRKFFKMTKRSTLAIQSLSLFNFGDQIPYRNLGILGGNSMMRGFYAGRFRDKTFLGLQAEYRFPLKGRLGGVAFTGLGQVGKDIPDLGFDRFKIAVGAGLRVAILKKEKLNLRFDVATGNWATPNYYIVLAESF